MIGLLTGVALNGIHNQELWVYQAYCEFTSDELKNFSGNYDWSDSFTDAVVLAMAQEFQFVSNIIDEVSRNGAAAYALGALQKPSKLSIAWQRVVLFVGLRKSRTLNEFFQAYSEISEQSKLPVRARRYVYSDEIVSRLRQRNWGSFTSRNPYGTVLLAILYPAMNKVLEKVELAKVSSSATQISFSLQTYYLKEGNLPETLEQLVPDYLAKIPLDPYDGQTMRYSKEKKIVYSVGNDFLDRGGSELPYMFQIDQDADDDHAAEHDAEEPTYPLRFAM